MNIFKRKKVEKKKYNERSIIQEYFGESFNLIAFHYAKNIYSIPEVRTAIEAVTDIFCTIPIYHKKIYPDGSTVYLEDEVDFILNYKPNKLQNGIQFWKSVIKQYLLENNIFIEPIFNSHNGRLMSLYPLPLRKFEFELQQNNAYVKFYDKPRGNIVEKYKVNDLIYLSRFSSVTGGAETNLGLYETVIQALSNQILKITDPKKIKAIVQGKTGSVPNLRPQDMNGEMKNIKTNFDNNIDGLAYLDPYLQITSVDWQENDVNRDLMRFVINVVYNYFKISEDIINNKASEIEREMFIAQTIKPIALQLEQELTYKLFTEREIREGHRIEFDTFALSVSTIQAKTALFSVGLRQGILNIDEAREYIGQPRLKDGMGQMYRVTGDTINLAEVDKFQAAQKGVTQDKNKRKEEDSG